MNWLAHALLSKPDIEFRLGNLLADLVKGSARANMSAAFLDGVRQHQAIDAFTDTHQTVHRSRARIGGDFRHATGILVDGSTIISWRWIGSGMLPSRWMRSPPGCTPTSVPI